MNDYGDDMSSRDHPGQALDDKTSPFEGETPFSRPDAGAGTGTLRKDSRPDRPLIESPNRGGSNGAAHGIGSVSVPKAASVVRDSLAHYRTVLANERTLLASVRTALALFVAGVSFVRFFDVLAVEVVGWIFVPAAVVLLLFAFARYRKMAQGLALEAGMDGDTGPGQRGTSSR